MILSSKGWNGKKLHFFKVNGKWRKSARFIGKLYVEYEYDTETETLWGSFGNVKTRTLSLPLPYIVEDYIWSE